MLRGMARPAFVLAKTVSGGIELHVLHEATSGIGYHQVTARTGVVGTIRSRQRVNQVKDVFDLECSRQLNASLRQDIITVS